MLKRITVLVLLASVSTQAQDDEPDSSSLRRPQRLTVGVGDQFLGQVEPDGESLIFVSNRFVATEIYRQDIEQGRERLLFDEGADVTWPRVSPDGKQLLYISFRERASGQLCIRDLPAAKERQCLGDEASALQAEWMDDAHIALVVRPSIEGDLALVKVTLGKTLVSTPLVLRNLTGPALSPDGRWLVYVPTERAATNVGPGFAARAASRLEALRLDPPNARPVPLDLTLPGLTGQPVFSRDGRWLYVVQFFTDSNGDGAIDASDRGVLFRVPFPSPQEDAATVAAAAIPEQLTSERFSCQYPAPGATALAATCQRGQSLDVYQLPLDGQVPSEWDGKRINAELAMAGSRADRLLLYHQRLQRETRPRARRMVMFRLAQLHLGFDNFEAAAFYAKHMHDIEKEPGTEGLAEPLEVLVAHRKAMRSRERGRMSDDEREAAAARFEALSKPAKSHAATVLQHVVRSELAQTGGDFELAKTELEAAKTAIASAERTPRAVLEAYYERADGLFRLLDDRDALVDVGRALSKSPAFEAADQLDYARAAVRTMYRGRPIAEADAAMAKALEGEPPDSEWAFALELGRRVNALNEERPPKELRDALLALYEKQTQHHRQRAVVEDGVARASMLGADGVLERLANAYVDDVPKGTQEERRAQRLYRRALLGRAYRRMAKPDRKAGAIADFDAVTKRTGALESAIEAMSLRMRGDGGMEPEAAAKEIHTDVKDKAVPLQHFVNAYALARTLPKLEGQAHADAVKAAKSELRAAWPQLKMQREAQALYGAIHHENFLHTGDRAAAERASRHYLVALELSGRNPRYEAMLHGALGLLHTQVGNFYLALASLEARDKLPYVDNGAGLAVSLARARALLHVGREADAVKAADAAIAMVAAKPRLEKFLPLVHDRAALCNLAAGNFDRALELYEKELPAVEASPRDAEGNRNRLVIRVARAAAALGAQKYEVALEELGHVDRELPGAAVTWPHHTPEQTLRGYRLIAAGLRANAELALGRPEAARQALEQRRTLFAEQAEEVQRDADLRALALAELRLAENAVALNDEAAAARWLGEALQHADQFVEKTHAEVDVSQLDVLLFAAQLDAGGKTKMPFDLKARLKAAHALLLKQPRAGWRPYLAWLEVYLGMGG